jgi:hypothetical protein
MSVETDQSQEESRNLSEDQYRLDEGFPLLPEEDPYTDFAFKIIYSEDETAYVIMRKDRKD